MEEGANEKGELVATLLWLMPHPSHPHDCRLRAFTIDCPSKPLVIELRPRAFTMWFARACMTCWFAFVFHVIENQIVVGQYIGADTYREGYATGPILNLCLPPE